MIWGISEKINNNFRLFVTHSFINFSITTMFHQQQTRCNRSNCSNACLRREQWFVYLLCRDRAIKFTIQKYIWKWFVYLLCRDQAIKFTIQKYIWKYVWKYVWFQFETKSKSCKQEHSSFCNMSQLEWPCHLHAAGLQQYLSV